MLKPYDKPEDVPEALREHYSRREDGKMHADIPNDHPAVKHNATLLAEKQAAEEKARTAESALESAKASGLPRGHKAVPSADAELVEKIKEAGIATVEDFATLKTEHGKFKQDAETATREKQLRDLGKAMGWDADKTALLLSAFSDLPDIELRDGTEKDAQGNLKKIAIAKVKGSDNVVTEKPFADHVAATERLNALVPALTASKQPDGTPLPSHGAGGGSADGEDLIAKRQKAKQAADAANPNPLMPKAVAA
jgi:hypothetical protein